ncbi:MAG: hypothetical protein Q8Q09_20540 [Deltaproteobacteria bacterium]|nr:hypothetical protein [Deltaproteobacteria bacterium]
MSEQDPPRLREISGPHDALRELICSAPEPPAFGAAAQARTLAAVHTATAASAPVVATALWTKVVAVALVGTLAALGWRWRKTPSAPTPSHAAIATVSPPALTVPNVPQALTAPTPTPTPTPTPAALMPAPLRTNTDSPSRVSERDLLAEAQRALERDNAPTRALTLLAEHRRRFARSTLDEERRVLTLRAYTRAENVPAARRTAEDFLRRYPQSLYGSAVRRWIEGHP